jgi:Asp-tRNA(Asn)/Glu-tRNA(Gln) amidotransferase A subunit family amidase
LGHGEWSLGYGARPIRSAFFGLPFPTVHNCTIWTALNGSRTVAATARAAKRHFAGSPEQVRWCPHDSEFLAAGAIEVELEKLTKAGSDPSPGRQTKAGARRVSQVHEHEDPLARHDANRSSSAMFRHRETNSAWLAPPKNRTHFRKHKPWARAAEIAVMRGDELGPLHGVPVSVKDLIDVAGLPARYGSLTMKDNVARADAPSVERLRRAGAIIRGKTATPEYGYQGITKSLVRGITRNPWNTPGGSSGGAVASVAAGVTPIAIGMDGGGSIRNPSALTGLVGIKANFARVPMWPAGVNPMLLHVGPIARSVADARSCLESLQVRIAATPSR